MGSLKTENPVEDPGMKEAGGREGHGLAREGRGKDLRIRAAAILLAPIHSRRAIVYPRFRITNQFSA